MNKFVFYFVLCVGAAFSLAKPLNVPVVANSVHARDYNFSFVNGNLLPNWSFEDGYYGWDGSCYTQKKVEDVVGGRFAPVSGGYVGVTKVNESLTSIKIPVEAGEEYALSFYVANLNGETIAPKIEFYYTQIHNLSIVTCTDYSSSASGWGYYSDVVKVPARARFAKIILPAPSSGVLFYDDVIFEKGNKPFDRNSVGMSIAYSDNLGRVYMQQTLLQRDPSTTTYSVTNKSVGNALYGSSRVEIGARSKVLGGNIVSGDYLFIDNDFTLRDEATPGLKVSAKNTIQLGDRDSLYADVSYGNSVNWNHQDFVPNVIKKNFEDSYTFENVSFDVGSRDFYVENEKNVTLAPGKYRNAMVRARSVLHLSAGEYYFETFTLEPTTVLDLDLSKGDVKIYVKSNLQIYDNVKFTYDANSLNTVSWYLNQSSMTRLGTGSEFVGTFIAPNARIELGHRSILHGAIYAKEVFLMQDAQVVAPLVVSRNDVVVSDNKQNLFVASENRYDNNGRVYQTDKPYVVQLDSEGFVVNSLWNANYYYSPSGDGKDAGNYAYTETVYDTKDGHVLKRSTPGLQWNVNSSHVGASDQVFVADLSIPSSLKFSNKPGDTMYVFTYTKDAEGVISMSWKNRLGQLVQTAHEVEAVGADMKNWKWAMKRYEYDRRGLLSRTVTPLDVKNNNFDFAIVSYYDGSGREIQRVSPDVGSQYFYYGIAGNMRASISSEQLSRQVFTYKKYDEQGRLVSIGESALPISQYNDDFIRKAALSDSDLPGTKVEYSGRGYDKLSKCLDAIGESTVSSFMKGKNLENTRGRTACAWTRNPKVVGAVTSGEAVVADFFSYDSIGRVKVTYRYTGVEMDANRKLVSKHAEYDDLGVLKNVSIRDAQGNELSRRVFKYDAKGRIASVEDASGNELVAYVYDDFGRQSEVVVGGAFRMSYDRHLHGQLTKITATKANSTDVLYEQELSYEDASGIAVPRFDGRISQINSSVQAVGSTVSSNNAYIYDMMGNMTRKLGTGAEAWFSYDENGRMLTQDDATGHMAYHYAPKSYRVTDVAGSVSLDKSRNASRTNNFVYDASGRVVGDASKNLSIEYDMSGLPVLFTVKDGSDLYHAINVYDPQGWRVGVLELLNNVPQSRRTDIMVDGKKELERRRDMVHATGATASQPSVSEYKMLYGAAGVLGRENAGGGREWYVKDYQGSLVMTVVNDAVGNVIAYEPYGSQKLLQANGDMPSEQYTGKELDRSLGLYYFGARFFDPTFAMWLSPDPAGQYLNPYSYGGDPVNAVDYDGRWSWKTVLGLGIVELATAGAVTSLIGAEVTTAAATATAAAGAATSPAIAPAAFNAPLISSVSGLIRGDFSASDVGNSFLNGLFIDAVGGVGNAAAFMTAFSYGRRCYYAEDCGAVVSDGVSGGFFVDDIGHMVGLANVAFMGGTADWFELGSVSSDYRGNTIYSGGFMNHVDGGGAFGGHATFVEDRKNREVIAHELNHTYQMEYEGNRFKYMYDYMEDNSWDPSYNSPTYYQNAKEMDSYYKAFLYENGCINVYGSNTGKCNNKEMSESFYQEYLENHKSEKDNIIDKYGENWTWRKNWWRDY